MLNIRRDSSRKSLRAANLKKSKLRHVFFHRFVRKGKTASLDRDAIVTDKLVTVDSTKDKSIRFTEPQIYSVPIPFDKSKNVDIKLTPY
jgi:hypothetical protein